MADYSTWYPPVQQTLLCLSKLYTCVEHRVFAGLAQDAIAACTEAVQVQPLPLPISTQSCWSSQLGRSADAILNTTQNHRQHTVLSHSTCSFASQLFCSVHPIRLHGSCRSACLGSFRPT